MNKYRIILLMFMMSLNSFGNSEPYFSIEDFSIYHPDLEEPLKLGMCAEEVVTMLNQIADYPEWETTNDGWMTLKYMAGGLVFYEFEADDTVFSFVITDPEFSLSRGIFVGDSIWDISRAYELYMLNPPPKGTFSRMYDDDIVIQQTFDRDAEHPGDLLTDYQEGRWKTYSMSFEYNEDDIITKIFVNKAFEY